MKVLILDSSNTDLSVGVSIDNKIIYKMSYEEWQRQSEFMIPEIEKAVKETGIELKDFDEILCGKGPGSYTGIRIALTIAKTISVMSGAKLKLISSLRMFGNREKKFIALINARSARSYIGVYDHDQVILEDTILSNEEVKKYIFEHPDYEVYGDLNYLNLKGKEPMIIEGMLSFSSLIKEEENPMSSKPVYLKD